MTTIPPPDEFRIGGSTRLHIASSDVVDGDRRGLVWLFEPPHARSHYVMGIDAAQGRTGWNRYSRWEDDSTIDNGAIEVIRIGKGQIGDVGYQPDVQVAEYAAPIDPYDLAKVANALGRLYGGMHEDGQALAIIEVYPGPGGPTQRQMMEAHGYTHMYQWQYLDTGEKIQSSFPYGWYSTKQSMQHLWTKGLRYIHRKQLVFKSPDLVEEFADCEIDTLKMRGRAEHGHDDRVMACLLAIWAAHNWSFAIDPVPSHVVTGPPVEWQQLDVSSERMAELYDARWEEICREVSQDHA